MKAKHTPGPWEISKHGTPAHSPQFGVYAPNSPWNGVNDLAIVKDDNAEANAQLIAAAPDLIEACKMAEEFLRLECDCSESDDDGNPLKELRAAIAKAEGNS